jgi:uncharacterized protein GlcG (DUF336 family)
MNTNKRVALAALVLSGAMSAAAARDDACVGLPTQAELKAALIAAVAEETSGLDLMWATIVDRDGVVCAVAFSGANRGSQWPGSRVISAQKANTANAFSLDGLALSTANLYSATQPGGSLYGLQHSNPVDTKVAYDGNAEHYGTRGDAMVGSRIGGVNVFGGGLGMYNARRKLVGALGVSGDTSCADHMIGWRLRNRLNFDYLQGVAGVAGDAARPDNIVYDIKPNPNGGTGASAGGFGHPMPQYGDPSQLPAVK